METPSVAFSTWIWAAFDPLLILVAVYLGWRADQAGKIALAAIAALGLSVLADWALSSLGIPLFAPVTAGGPMLLPVRTGAAALWAALAFGLRRWVAPRS